MNKSQFDINHAFKQLTLLNHDASRLIYSEVPKERIEDMAVNGSGIRDTARASGSV